jgi:signal transduction histidine kinase
MENIHLDNLCKETMEQLELLAMEKNIFLEQDIEPVEITADKDKLKQLLLNLLDNGIKYNKEKGKLKISLRQKDKNAEIKISDNGIGISQEDINHIFERFYRVDKARSREMGGSGLGLSIVKWIIDLHRGTINVTSEPNKGTTFTITLPLQ